MQRMQANKEFGLTVDARGQSSAEAIRVLRTNLVVSGNIADRTELDKARRAPDLYWGRSGLVRIFH